MAERPQGDEIDQELRRAMRDIALVPEPAREFDELFSPTLTLEGEQTMEINSRNVLIAAAAAIIAVLIGVVLFAPSDEGGLDTIDSPGDPTVTVPDEASGSTEVPEVDAPSVAVPAVDEPRADDLLGRWLSTFEGIWTISDGTITVEAGTVDEFTYTATESTIELVDTECGPDVVGTYSWVIEDEELTLTTLDDECGRGIDLDGVTFERAQSPIDLLGVWESTNLERPQTWTIAESGILIENGFVESQTYTATNSTIELVDGDCGVLVPGLYDWEIVDDLLTLTVVEDECARADTLDGTVLERVG